MSVDVEGFADVVVSTISRALAPLQTALADMRTRQAVLEAGLAGLQIGFAQSADLLKEFGAVRERLAVVEVRQPIPGLNGKDAAPVDLDDLAQRAAALVPVPNNGERGQAGDVGPRGQDAPPVDLDDLVRRTVALIPVPSNGRDGQSVDAAALQAELHTALDTAVEKHCDALAGYVVIEVKKAVDALERPRDGQPGKDADPEFVRLEVAKAVALVPQARDGQDGKDGKDLTLELVEARLTELVTRAVAAMPFPKDGQDGAPGTPGVGVAGAVLNQHGELILTLSDGTLHTLGVVVGRDGQKGEPGSNGSNGVDGLGFDDLDAVTDEVGRVSLRIARGDVVKLVRLPGFVDRGVFKDGLSYEAGDGVSFGGSFWLAKAATTQKPGDGVTAWRLAVKVGREGRGLPGASGPAGPKGDKGDPGRDLR